MKKNIVILSLFALCAGVLVRLNRHKPNNQYELLVYQDHFKIMDGERQVINATWEKDAPLEKVIISDNQ